MRIDREQAGVTELEEALFGRGIANTNAVIALAFALAKRGLIDRDDVALLSDAFSRPLVIDGPRENELLTDLHNDFDKQMSTLIKVIDESQRT